MRLSPILVIVAIVAPVSKCEIANAQTQQSSPTPEATKLDVLVSEVVRLLKNAAFK